jgi:hypothetical protein
VGGIPIVDENVALARFRKKNVFTNIKFADYMG